MNLTEPLAAADAVDDHGGREAVAPVISVVIPTRNRTDSLARTLAALARQECLPFEVIVVDASEPAFDASAIQTAHPALRITVIPSLPHVCAQRNRGIRAARGSHVLLCDDDIEPAHDYLRRLGEYLQKNPTAGAVTGVVCEPDSDGAFQVGFEVPSVRHLCFAFLFQLTVWADVEKATAGPLAALPLAALKRWYARRGNRWSAAGWPLVTQVRGPVFRTAFYGLGAALVRRDWLLAAPFDERLGPHGIGDNYGVALGFPAERAIAVIADLRVLHHRAIENRLDISEAYFRRVLALDYFMRSDARFGGASRLWLAWSLLGKGAVFALRRRRDMLRATLRALGLVVTGRNSLLAAGQHVSEPQPMISSGS